MLYNLKDVCSLKSLIDKYDLKTSVSCILEFCLLCFSSTLVLDKKLVHVVYSKLDRDVLVIAMPAEKYVYTEWPKIKSLNLICKHEICTIGILMPFYQGGS